MLKKINEDLKKSLKQKDKKKTLVLRGLLAALHNEKIKLGKDNELTEEKIIEVLSQEAKKRKDAIELYGKGNRQDKVDAEKAELKIIEKYLPEQLSKEELSRMVKEAIEETGAESIQDMGKVMGTVMSKVKGQADGKKVKEIVQENLS